MRKIIFALIIMIIIPEFYVAQTSNDVISFKNDEITSNTSMDTEAFNLAFGIKGGIGFWKFANLKESSRIFENSYPVGYLAGLYIENKLSDDFSIQSGLFYQNTRQMVTVVPSYSGHLEQRINSHFLFLPILLKYQTSLLWDTYFLLGPGFGYLLQANYSYYDRYYRKYSGSDINITEELPKFSASLEFGFGEKLKFINSKLFIELKVQLGLTNFRFNNLGFQNIGEWKNSGLILAIGFKF